jgi:hypothetical protein
MNAGGSVANLGRSFGFDRVSAFNYVCIAPGAQFSRYPPESGNDDCANHGRGYQSECQKKQGDNREARYHQRRDDSTKDGRGNESRRCTVLYHRLVGNAATD